MTADGSVPGRVADRARRHTRYFLRWARAASPVHLGADIDMTRVTAHRAAAHEAGRRYSYVAYLLHATARVVAAHPEARAYAGGVLRPRTVPLPGGRGVGAKLALDTGGPGGPGGARAVRTVVLPGADTLTLDGLQDLVDRHREAAPHELPGAEGIRMLCGLPPPLGELAFRYGVRGPAARARRLGTYAVSVLGHRAVDVFHSYGGTAVTFCAGRVAERPVARDGRVRAAPVMRLGLTFDHRALDGAAAADVLDGVVMRLEGWHGDLPGAGDEPGGGEDVRAAGTRDRAGGPVGTGP